MNGKSGPRSSTRSPLCARSNLAVPIPNALIEQYQNNVTERSFNVLNKGGISSKHSPLTLKKSISCWENKIQSQYNTLLLCSDENSRDIQEAQPYRASIDKTRLTNRSGQRTLKTSKDIELKNNSRNFKTRSIMSRHQPNDRLHPDVKKLRARVKQVQLRIRENQQEDLLTHGEIFTSKPTWLSSWPTLKLD